MDLLLLLLLPQSDDSPVAAFSRSLVDSLPKQVGIGGDGGGGDACNVSRHLDEKMQAHRALLRCLADGGTMEELAPWVLRHVQLQQQNDKLIMHSRYHDC